jgi:hypothetical protein
VDPCPLDHVLDLENGISQKHGPIESVLREYSFLNNSRLPASVRQSVVALDPPHSLSETHLGALRASAAAARVLTIQGAMPDLYATLPASEAAEARERMMWFTSLWCCSVPPKPKMAGHIFYDLFHDVVPHTDKFKRKWTEPWYPTFGP